MQSSDLQSIVQANGATNGIALTASGKAVGTITHQTISSNDALCLNANQRLVLTSGSSASAAISSGTGQISSNVYVMSSSENAAVNAQDQLVIGNNGLRQRLTLSSGHADLGSGQ